MAARYVTSFIEYGGMDKDDELLCEVETLVSVIKGQVVHLPRKDIKRGGVFEVMDTPVIGIFSHPKLPERVDKVEISVMLQRIPDINK